MTTKTKGREVKRKKKSKHKLWLWGNSTTQYYDVSKWGVCLVTWVPVKISIAPVAATLTAVESH